MPELPEVETVVRSLSGVLPGARILAAEFGSRFVTPGNRKALARRLASQTIHAIRRHGKFIVLDLDSGVLVVHLGMTGKLLFDAPRGRHAYGVFHLDRGQLIYDDPRQFGRIEWAPALPARVARLGPDPLEVGFAEFWRELKRRRSAMKPLLLNQRFLRGVGNIYADEALHRARIHPKALSARISRKRALRLYESITEILRLAIEHRGSSISDYVDAEGTRGWFQVLHRVYGKEGEPCPECGSPIRRIVIAQRSAHFCPRCQRA
jgi:formamidopyrimidine-DNA glycosylase